MAGTSGNLSSASEILVRIGDWKLTMDEKHDMTPRSTLRNGYGKRLRLSKPSSSHRHSSNGRVNPFERDLLNKLHLPVWSPSILNHPVDTPPRRDWAIDEISKLNPTQIEDSPSTHQETESLSQELEEKVQADIEHFFTNNPLPSPIVKDSRDKCINTELSFPVILPPEVEQVLSQFMNVGVNDSDESGDVVYSDENKELNKSLSRKLEFSFDDEEDLMMMMENTTDMSMKSEDIHLNMAQRHGALIMSPNPHNAHQYGQFLSPASVSTPVQRRYQNTYNGNNTQEMICSTPS